MKIAPTYYGRDGALRRPRPYSGRNSPMIYVSLGRGVLPNASVSVLSVPSVRFRPILVSLRNASAPSRLRVRNPALKIKTPSQNVQKIVTVSHGKSRGLTPSPPGPPFLAPTATRLFRKIPCFQPLYPCSSVRFLCRFCP